MIADVGPLTPKDVASELAKVCPAIGQIPERDREVIALHAIYLPANRIAAMLGMDPAEVAVSISRYAPVAGELGEAIKMRILRMTVWRFASVAVSTLMEAKDMDADEAVKSLKEIPGIIESLTKVERLMIQTEKQHKEMNFADFGQSLGKP